MPTAVEYAPPSRVPRALLLLCFCICLLPDGLRASPRCGRLQTEGLSLYNQRKFQLALKTLEEAQRCQPHPRILLYIGLTHQELGQDELAREHFRQVEAVGGNDRELVEHAREATRQLDAKKRSPSPTKPPIVSQTPPKIEPEINPPGSSELKSPLYKRWWLWAAVGGAAAVIVSATVAATWPKLPEESAAERIPYALTVHF